jgi:hypothetical protein
MQAGLSDEVRQSRTQPDVPAATACWQSPSARPQSPRQFAVDGDTDEHVPMQSPTPLRQLLTASRKSPVQPEMHGDTLAPVSFALQVARQARASVRAERIHERSSLPQPAPQLWAWLGATIRGAMLHPTIRTISAFM